MPFLLLAYIVYYGLPSIGLSFDNWSAGLVALIVYNTAYMAEILRGAWIASRASRSRRARLRLFGAAPLPPHRPAAAGAGGRTGDRQPDDPDHQGQRLPHHHRVPELTHAASSIQSRHYIPFAAFIVAVFLYWGLCLWSRPRVAFGSDGGGAPMSATVAAMPRSRSGAATRPVRGRLSSSASARSRCSTASSFRWSRARPSACSGLRAPASRRCFAASTGSKCPMPARSTSRRADRREHRRRGHGRRPALARCARASAWCSSTSRCGRISPCCRT